MSGNEGDLEISKMEFRVEGCDVTDGVVGTPLNVLTKSNVILDLERFNIAFFAPTLPSYSMSIEEDKKSIKLEYKPNYPGSYKVYLTYDDKLIIKPFMVNVAGDPIVEPPPPSAGDPEQYTPPTQPLRNRYWHQLQPLDFVLGLLEQGEEEMILSHKDRDLVLILGNAGSGKTTLAKLLAGDNSRLVCQEVDHKAGEFVITDLDEDEDFEVRQKIVPERFVLTRNSEANVVFYDCVSFEDTRMRNPVYEIPTAYFAKLLVDHAKSLKIIFAINSTSVLDKETRTDFLDLISHVSTFIRDVVKYSDGIMLVATKASNDTGIPDSEIIGNIGKCITESIIPLLESKVEGAKTDEEKRLCVNGVNLAKIIVRKKQEDVMEFERISLLRQPDAIGPVSQSSLLQDEKSKILKALDEGISFVQKSKDDFDPSLSVQSRNSIPILIDIVQGRIGKCVQNITAYLKKYYKAKRMNSYNTNSFEKEMTDQYAQLSALQSGLSNLKGPRDKIDFLREGLAQLNINIPEFYFEEIVQYSKYLDFLELVSPNGETYPTIRVAPLAGVVTYVDSVLNGDWYKLLSELYDKLSSYEMVSQPDKYNVANLDDWGQIGKPPGISINDGNINQFLRLNGSNFWDFKFGKLTPQMIKELDELLEITLRAKPPDMTVTDGRLTVKGEFVILSHVLTKLGDYSNSGIQFVDIYALNSFFLNMEVFSCPGINLTIISPKCVFRYTRAHISLSGNPGPPHTPPKANSGSDAGVRGMNGIAGKPGQTAGSFMGVFGKTVIHPLLQSMGLVVNCIGGAGGTGQEGGDGAPGKENPKNAQVPANYMRYPENPYELLETWSNTSGAWFTTSIDNFWRYLIKGGEGGKGGDGGRGGKGGLGGRKGTVNLVSLDSQVFVIRTEAWDGYGGNGGNGGTGADGGKGGDNVLATYYSWTSSYSLGSKWIDISTEEGELGESGKNGPANANDKGMEKPKESLVQSEFCKPIIELKEYSRENLKDVIRSQSLKDFLNRLDKNETVQNIYGAVGLIDDFASLENQYYKFGRKVSFLEFYKEFLERIQTYADNHTKNKSLSQSEKKALCYLYTCVLTKIQGLKARSQTNLVIDIRAYMDTVKENIQALEKAKRTETVKHCKEAYTMGLDKKVGEANRFIKNEISPEIDRILYTLDVEIDKFIDEVIELQKVAESEKEKLVEAQKKLQNSLFLIGFLEVIKLGASVASICGPIGIGFSTAAGMGVSLLETLDLDGNPTHTKFELPEAIGDNIKLYESVLKENKDSKVNALKELIQKVKDHGKDQPEKLGDIENTIKGLEKQLEDVKNLPIDQFSDAKYEAINKQIKWALEQKEMNLENEKNQTEFKTQKALETVRYLKNAQTLLEASVGTFNKYQETKEKLEAAAKAVADATETIEKLKKFRENIDKSIIPMFQGMKKNFDDVQSSLDSKSPVALDVTKWRVQGTLKDICLQMKVLTEGFKVQGEMLHCIEKLGDGMTTLIVVYDRIETIYENQRLAEYIANIYNSTGADLIQIDDEKLRSAVNRLDNAILTNVVLLEYERVMNTFNQWIFPFGGLYFSEFNLPDSLTFDTTPKELVGFAVERIDKIRANVKDYYQSIQKWDKSAMIGYFTTEENTRPFYTWGYEKFSFEINQLLEGKEVVFISNVNESHPNKSAIKFSKLDLKIKIGGGASENQKKVNDIVKSWEIRMTHNGNSFYRYQGLIYLISGDEQVFQFGVSKDSNGDPVTMNMVYRKIKDGDLMLSPYTTWSIKLIPDEDYLLSLLQPYSDQISLELSGYGKYVDETLQGRSISYVPFD